MGEPGVSSGHLMMIEQPGRQRRGDLAHGLRDGEVPGREAGHGADRLHDHHVAHAVGAGRDDAAVGALTLAGEPVDDVGGADELELRLGQDLALLLGQHLGDLLGARAQQVGRLAQDLAALVGGHLAPGLEALVDGGQCLVEVALGGEPQLADRLAVGGVDHVLGLAGRLDPVAVDVVLKRSVHTRVPPRSFGDIWACRITANRGRLRKWIPCSAHG